MKQEELVILGGGVTGLAAGLATGAPIYEARRVAGGICASYYLKPGDRNRLPVRPAEGAYRFEYGGGHWIFGGDPSVLALIDFLAPSRRYRRRSSIFFKDERLLVPYPIQNHLASLGKDVAVRALTEILNAPRGVPATMAQWLEQHFGQTLMQLFFEPFHERYTAGLFRRIAPQDDYKSPLQAHTVIQGALHEAPAVGYNVVFVYPEEGLNALAERMASLCDVHYGKEVVRIDSTKRVLEFSDGTALGYRRVISTLPLNRLCEMVGATGLGEPDPYTSVLVVNIGGLKGPNCPSDHWIYVPRSRCGFHRVGFYNHVDPSFLPGSSIGGERVGLYVEQAFLGGARPSAAEMEEQSGRIIEELIEWGMLEQAEVVDPTWIDVAYTWTWPGSSWKPRAFAALKERDIVPVGRYARWVFQGIADSIRDGFVTGTALRWSGPKGPSASSAVASAILASS